jgi:6-phospho-3-hexuloisomerase
MQVRFIMQSILDNISKTIKDLDEKHVEILTKEIRTAERIFLWGAGRSGLMAKAFAMRLSQLGFVVYVVGETISPGMKRGDLFIAVSGSGETISVVNAAKAAKEMGVKVIAVTSYENSTLGKTADKVIRIKGKTKVDIEKDHLKHQIQGVHSSLTPLGTLFEDTVLVFFDGVIGKLMGELNATEHHMLSRHPIE